MTQVRDLCLHLGFRHKPRRHARLAGFQSLSPEKIVMPFAPPVDAAWYPQSVETPVGQGPSEHRREDASRERRMGVAPRTPHRGALPPWTPLCSFVLQNQHRSTDTEVTRGR